MIDILRMMWYSHLVSSEDVMRTFKVVSATNGMTKAEAAKVSRPYWVADNDGNVLTRRGSSAARSFKTAKSAQKIADLCNDAESYPHS